MLRLAICAPLALALLPLTGGSKVAPCANLFPHEPAVIYELSGGTIAGPYDLELVVYGDGSARLCSSTALPGGKCQQVDVGAAAAANLLDKLSAANAFRQCDNNAMITDMPLATLTVMRPKPDTSAHTMSWILADDAFQDIERLLSQFEATWFPGF